MSSPRISVRTKGPRLWSISVSERPEAERAQRDFRDSGLACSPIEQRGENFVFTADAQMEIDNWSEPTD